MKDLWIIFFGYNGNKILLEMFLQNIHCDFLTYQIRVRNKKLVLHSGGCYAELTKSKCTMLKIFNIELINFNI